MIYGQVDLKQIKKNLDSVSPCLCLAKWMHTTLHLLNGRTHSCFLPPTHKIPLSEISIDPASLHNTNYKKSQRKLMKEGTRPGECKICWDVEDLPGEQISERILRSSEAWARPHFETVKINAWDKGINPSYLEVSFSNLCQFKCSYCSPHVSSKWHEEIQRHGPYALSGSDFQSLKYLEDADLMPLDENTNPYIEAFWKWWLDLYKDLRILRITGGEPLLSKHTFKVLNWLKDNPNPQLGLEVNSNLGVSAPVLEKFFSEAEVLVNEKKIQFLRIYTSLDAWGKKAEYIRHGLKFEEFQNNLESYLQRFATGGLSITCTYNALSVVGFRDFLKWFLELRKKYGTKSREIFMDLPHLVGPAHQSVRILPSDYREIMQKDLEWMKTVSASEPYPRGFRQIEMKKLERIIEWSAATDDPRVLDRDRNDFFKFFSEHDRRRNTSFENTFPEMTEFWDLCRNLDIQRSKDKVARLEATNKS